MDIERSPELERFAEEAHDAWERGDTRWYAERLSSQDPIMLGSAPEEEIRGAQAVGNALGAAVAERESLPFKSTRPRVLDARQCGDIGWTIGETEWEFEDGTSIAVRGLTILHREDGEWKAV